MRQAIGRCGLVLAKWSHEKLRRVREVGREFATIACGNVCASAQLYMSHYFVRNVFEFIIRELTKCIERGEQFRGGGRCGVTIMATDPKEELREFWKQLEMLLKTMQSQMADFIDEHDHLADLIEADEDMQHRVNKELGLAIRRWPRGWPRD